MRFHTGSFKIGDKILSQNVLKLNNVMYELTGIVIHRGDTMNSGHYYSITHCWDNGNAWTITINFWNHYDLEFEFFLIFKFLDHHDLKFEFEI